MEQSQALFLTEVVEKFKILVQAVKILNEHFEAGPDIHKVFSYQLLFFLSSYMVIGSETSRFHVRLLQGL